MLRVSALYVNQDDAWFDFDYYRTIHFPMAFELLKPFGALRFEIDRGIESADGRAPPFLAVGHLIFESTDRLAKGLATHGARMAADVKNFTNVPAQLQVSEIIQ
jgi:uncharacterized protein (TIGR02118 family)